MPSYGMQSPYPYQMPPGYGPVQWPPPPPQEFGGLQPPDTAENATKPEEERCTRCDQVGCVATTCPNKPRRPTDKRLTMFCLAFQKPLMGNGSGAEGKKHCGNPNCVYVHVEPTDPTVEQELQERYDRLKEKGSQREAKGGADKGGKCKDGKGGFRSKGKGKGGQRL